MGSVSKVVMVTGATSGFGKATALRLAGEGYKVYGFGRSVDETMRESGGNLTMIRMDIKDAESVRRGTEAVIAAEGRVDVLINAAGRGYGGSIEDTSIDEAREAFETNVFGTMQVNKAVLPHMRARKSGLIILVSSIGGIVGLPFEGLYSATKFAVEGMGESLAMEVRPFGIDVVIVEPGDANTGFNAGKFISAAATSDASPYRQAFGRVMKRIDKDETTGYEPEVFAAALSRIILSRRRKLRYLIGSPLQKSSVLLKRLLPQRAFESLMSSYYNVSK